MIDILFAIDISEKNYRKEWSGQGQTLKLLSWFKIWIMLYYLKWIREHREREIEQLISANSWYNTVLWLVSKSQTVLWLAWWTFNRWISKVETDTQTHRQIDLIELLTFAVKNQGKMFTFKVAIESSKLLWPACHPL